VIVISNPFTLGIVSKKDFCNRSEELENILRHVRGGNNVVLLSPRRFGKSSLVYKALEVLERKGFLCVYVDLFPVISERDFIERFSIGVFKGIGRGADPRTIGRKVLNMFARLIPSFEVKPDGVGLSVKLDRSTDNDLLLDDLMAGICKYVKGKKTKACIALDEFQEITELPESKKIEGILRSHIQHHKEISYLFIGSRRRILQDMFSKKRPFYKSAFSYTLKEIPADEFIKCIVDRFKESGKSCPSEIAEGIYEMVRGYPYYVKKLSAVVWDLTTTQCDPEILREAYRILLETEGIDFEGIWSSLTLTNKAVLKAIAKEPTASPYARAYLERYQLSLGGAQRAIKNLLNKDLIEKVQDGKYRVTDPVFGVWCRVL